VQELSGSTATANLLSGPSVDEVFTRTDSAGARNFLTDALGSTLALTDSSSAIQTQYTYGPFGSTSSSGSSSTNAQQFTGRENDGTGLYYYRARYYSPTTGRILSEDPSGFAGSGPNLYEYAGDDPVNFNDPFGLDRNAPNNWASKQAQCAGQAALQNAIPFGTDALGAIPGEGQALAIAQLTAGGVGFVNGLATKDGVGAIGSIIGDQTIAVVWAANSSGAPLAKSIPVAGNIFSALLAARDIYNAYQDYKSCMAGANVGE
jgi:RHS repeat-associated protein